MELEKQVVSLELAKKLKELGVKQESLYAYYGNAGTWHNAIVDMSMYKDADPEFREAKLLPAYTVAELGEMLPASARWHTNKHYVEWLLMPIEWNGHLRSPSEFKADTEADARAKMLCYLLENKLITI